MSGKYRPMNVVSGNYRPMNVVTGNRRSMNPESGIVKAPRRLYLDPKH